MAENQSQTSSVNYSAIAGQLLASMVELYPSFRVTLEDSSLNTRKMWEAHLREFSPEVIERAANRMINKHQTFAPTIGEFKSLCKGVDGKPVTPGITYKPKSAASVAEKYLQQMREVTGAKSYSPNP